MENVDFETGSINGLEASPAAQALAGLRANEARYFKNKYNHNFSVTAAEKDPESVEYVKNILLKERKLTIASMPLETSSFFVIKGEY
jgi:hypothetical protein